MTELVSQRLRWAPPPWGPGVFSAASAPPAPPMSSAPIAAARSAVLLCICIKSLQVSSSRYQRTSDQRRRSAEALGIAAAVPVWRTRQKADKAFYVPTALEG